MSKISIGLILFILATILILSFPQEVQSKYISEPAVYPSKEEFLKHKTKPNVKPKIRREVKPRTYTVHRLRPATYSGNTYYWGNCTWYAKNRRTDLPNNLGNAITWFSRARQQNIPTGYIPRVRSVVVMRESYLGHVAVVEKVNNGSIYISEMNVVGKGVLSYRTLRISDPQIIGYIY